MMNRVIKSCLGIGALVVLTLGHVSGAETMDLSGCLSRFQGAFEPYQHLSADIDVTCTIVKAYDDKQGANPPDGILFKRTVNYHRDHTKLHINTRHLQRGRMQGSLHERMELGERVVTSDSALSIPLTADGKSAAHNSIVAFDLATKRDEAAKRVFGAVSLFVMDGNVDYFGPPLMETLASPKSHASLENQDGRKLARIEFDGEPGRYVLWLDIEKNYHPIRFVQTRVANSNIGQGRRLKETDTPGGKLTSAEIEIIYEKLQKVDGAWIADRCQEITRSTTDLGKSSEYRRSIEFRNVSLRQNHDYKVQAKIPNGTRVNVEGDTSGIVYEWNSGNIVKSIDKKPLKFLEVQEFKQNWSFVTFTLMLASLAVAAGIGFYFYGRRK